MIFRSPLMRFIRVSQVKLQCQFTKWIIYLRFDNVTFQKTPNPPE